MAEQEVNTVFTVTDQSSGPQKKMGEQAEKLAGSAKKAQKALDLQSQLSKAEQKLAAVKADPETSRKLAAVQRQLAEQRKQAAAPTDDAPAAPVDAQAVAAKREQEMFKQDRAEMQLRKKRMRHQKLEMGREQMFHRLGEMALMSVIGEQNKVASGLAKTGAMMQGMGTSMAGFGGTVGKLGGALSSLGGYAALAGLALEGISAVTELFGVDMNDVMKEAKKTVKSFLGMKTDDLAHAMGFRSDEERKTAEKLREEWQAEADLTRELSQRTADLAKWPTVETAASVQAFHDKALEMAKQIPGNMKLEDKIAKIEAAAKGSVWSMEQRYRNEQKLNQEIERNILPHLQSLPVKGNAQAMANLNLVIAGYTQDLVDNQTITHAEAAATAEKIRQTLEERGTVQSVIDQYRKSERVQGVMDEQVRRQIHHLKVIPLKSSAARVAAFNDTIAQLARHMAELSHWTPEQTTEYLSKLKEAATEKQQRVFDFRYARFDIRQAFADVDPDRIAVAFANSLGAMGERRVQSSFAPLWSI